MWIAFVVAVVATAGNHIGKVFQKRGTDDLPELSLQPEVLKAYFTNRHWLGGFLGDAGGAICTAIALGLAPVSTVQPVISAGVLFLVLFSHFYLGEHVRRREWAGVGLAVLGAVGIGLTMTQGHDRFHPQAGVVALLCVLAVLGVCEVLYRRGRWLEFSTGLQAGVGFGLSAAVMRSGMVLAKQHGQVLWAVVGIGCSVACTSLAFYLQTRGLKHGRAVAIGTYTNIFVLVTAVLIGLFALNEPMPSTSMGVAVRLSSFGLIGVGAALMAQK